GEPFFVPSDAANGAGGLEFLRIMLSKGQAQNFSEMTSSVTILKDTIPEDAFGSTALASTDEMITAAGEDTFHFNYRAWYGPGADAVAVWTESLNCDLTACRPRERERGRIDAVGGDNSTHNFHLSE